MIDHSNKSSNIKNSHHISEQNKLIVEFKSGGLYEYNNVTADQYEEMINSDSIGGYFTKNIVKNPRRHPYSQISKESKKEDKA